MILLTLNYLLNDIILGVLLCIKIYCFIFSIEVQLVYNVVLVSGVQHSDSVTHIYISILFIIIYYRILNIVSCGIQ